MNVLLPLLIVAIVPDMPPESRFPEALGVFHCTFDSSWDQNFDEWPDDWTRRRGQGFPPYVSVKLCGEPSLEGGGCLRIELDGGAAVAYSPAIEVDASFGYILEGRVKTEGLEHDRAYFSVTLMDGQRQRLDTFYSEKVCQTHGWQKLRLGPIAPQSHDARLAIIALHLQPESEADRKGLGADLKGTAWFDDVWLGRLPRLDLSTTTAEHFYDQAEQVEVYCIASGLADLEERPQIEFQLEDVQGRELARGLSQLSRGEDGGGDGGGVTDSPAKASWRPPLVGPGFYRIRATMRGHEGLVVRRELTVAVFDGQEVPRGGEFGWTLPQGDRTLSLPLLSRVIAQAGINWVKYPLWYDPRRGDELIEEWIGFGERLGQHGIELVGLLNEPPGPQPLDDVPTVSRSAADIFTVGPESWYPAIEPALSRLATRVRWWQLGDDKDTSLVDCPNLAGRIGRVKGELDRIGCDVNLGIGWGWLDGLPQAPEEGAPWRFLSLSADPPMTHDELGTYLDATQESGLRRWVVVEPLPKDDYPLEVRAADLVRRMIAAKVHGADAVFCPDPLSTQRGLLRDDGTPGELLFTWRAAARVLGGARYCGSIQLPGGSPNQVFAREDDMVMVVWNEEPTDEVIYLGEHVRQIDMFGRSQEPRRQGDRQVIHAGPLPSFVTGLDGPITRWRLDVAVAEQRIPSISDRSYPNSLRLVNQFPRAIAGRATLVTPETWPASPAEMTFYLAEGEPLQQQFEVSLPRDADTGSRLVRIDFVVEADRSYSFSVYRRMEVGLGEVAIDVSSRLNDRGELEVRQRLVNGGDEPVSFRCELFAPDRRRQQTRVIELHAGRDEHLYRMADGRELLGETLWLRAEEIRGPRVLNYRFQAEP